MKKILTCAAVLPILLALLVAGCTVDDPSHPTGLVTPTGTALFANYVSMGNSLTAGFMDAGLMIDGQLNSFPALIAGQIGIEEFTQPYVSRPGLGSTEIADPTSVAGVMYFDGSSMTLLGTTPYSTVLNPASGFLMAAALPTPYNNLGVPGATLHDVMNTYDSSGGNPMFDIVNRASFFGNVEIPASGIAPAYQSASMFRQAVAQGPTLCTFWIGNNDVLGAALSGDPDVTPPTDVTTFQTEYQTVLTTLAGGLLTRNGFPSTIIVANIPSITSIPYFIPKANFEAALPEALGGSWPWGYEEADTELVLLSALSWIADTDNQGSPIPTDQTLDTAEVAIVETAVASFNAVISGMVDAFSTEPTLMPLATVALFDANDMMANVTTTYGPLAATHFLFALELTGGDPTAAAQATLFSLDGIHPNNVGYGLVANGFLTKINEVLETDVPMVDLSTLSWDPNYGQGYPAKSLDASGPMVPAELGEAMRALFQ